MGTVGTEAPSINEKGPARTVQSFFHPRMMMFFLLLGIALRVWAYARDTSLYLDEILPSRNILDLPLWHLLTKPLMLDQVAPRGFLLVEHLAVVIFDPSEMALRLVPFVCSITSVVLFRRLAERILTADGRRLRCFFSRLACRSFDSARR